MQKFTTTPRLTTALATSAAALALLLAPTQRAEACGCFAPPDPSVPIVQAGEQIVFSHDDGMITAHIQIQYQGEANEFGWILPLPSVPDMTLGTDELFTQLVATTQPKYRLNRIFEDSCLALPQSAGSTNESFNNRDDGASEPSIVVKQDSIGPFDYAVLKADDRTEMFEWLTENSYFIPTGTEDVVGPYIHEGAFFLALKLRKGNDTGDIQPVVLRYASDLPMIPIILTQVAANPDMGIRVWVLGEHRAIPRNYRHTVLNEEYIDWFNAGSNYNDIVIAATNEAPDGQSFVTEYAGSVERMVNVLDAPGRFGDRSTYEAITEPGLFLQQMRADNFPWSSGVLSAIKTHIPYPAGLANQGITEDDFYDSADYYLTFYREDNQELFEDYEFDFNHMELTAQLWDRVVKPTLEAGDLFRTNAKMTRMYTTLSPEEMSKDPTFSFNPSLPDVDNEHNADFTVLCDGSGNVDGSGILRLPDGRRFFINDAAAWSARNRTGVPYSRRIELLREEGAPMVEIDNATRLSDSDADSSGCTCLAGDTPMSGSSTALSFAALAAAGLLLRRRRR